MYILIFVLFFFITSSSINPSDIYPSNYEKETFQNVKQETYLFTKIVTSEPYYISFSTNVLSKLVFFISLCHRIQEKKLEAFLFPLTEFPGPNSIVTRNNKQYLCVGDDYTPTEEQLLLARIVFDAEKAIDLVQKSTLFQENIESDSDIEDISVSYISSSVESE